MERGRWWISNPCGGRGSKELPMKEEKISTDEYDKNMDENDERIKAAEEKDLSTDVHDKNMDENDKRIKVGKEREKSSPEMDT